MKKSIIAFGIALISVLGTTEVTASSPVTSVLLRTENPTPLCLAIAKGEFEVVKKFIEYGVNVNERSNGMTPLMIAARYNKVEIVKHLIEKGARIDEKSENGFTALKWAEASGSNDVVAFLKQRSAK